MENIKRPLKKINNQSKNIPGFLSKTYKILEVKLKIPN